MTHEQLTETILSHNRELAELGANLKSAHRRIDESDRIANGVHKLAANVEALALQVKLLGESVNVSVKKLEEGQKHQGERIGTLEKEPAHKWKSLVSHITALIVAAVFGAIMANFIA
ncbi:MAG: hypothetical protein FWH00_00825 [Oscillospiraceae bacterium]|nr:hypothetical protein [Oscillospiraceae bacterium]